jgi:hypothetical protein
MGCNACGFNEEEEGFGFPNDGKLDNKSIQPKDFNNFMSIFEQNLHYFGEYIDEEKLKKMIPEKINKYMEEHPFQNQTKETGKTYKTKPIIFKNGNIYHGNWNKEYKMEGKGKYYLKEENVFAEGNWVDGELKYARVFLPNGDIYEGELRDSMFNGQGKLISYNSKDIYEGNFVNGEKTGNGKITFSDGTIYEGELENGEFKGNGKMTWKNGYEYDGEFNGRFLNGKGTLTCPNKDVYNGDFENSYFHGKGKYVFFKTGNEYDGDFQYGVRKGKGNYSVPNKYKYKGNWDNDLPCGIGRLMTWDESSVLKCTWRFGKIAEEPIYEIGNEEDFNSIDKNIEPEMIDVNIRQLPHIDIAENESTQYKIETYPSFLQE